MLKSFRYVLLPFSLIYGGIVWLRNWLFDKNYLKSATFNFPIICIGNLAVGGTGKTPMTEYMLRVFKNDFKTATLSRGYKRKTTGFAIADERTTALEIGDEPMQFHQKFPDVIVAVGESRLEAIPQLLQARPETELIILDDAFQHRSVNAGLNIVLTEFNNLYTRDFMLPAGDLRDVRASIKRAHIIIVTKSEPGLSVREKKRLLRELRPLDEQHVFFTKIEYGLPYHLFSKEEITIGFNDTVFLICGIASPRHLKEWLTAKVHSYHMLRYPDHHIFDMDDLDEIKKEFAEIVGTNKLILTTEKDAVRLTKFEAELKDFPIYVLPIQHAFLFGEAVEFEQLVTGFVHSFKK